MELSINEGPTRDYAFTLRRTTLKNKPTEQMYINHMNAFEVKEFCVVKDFVFEHTAGLHMHGILTIPKRVDIYKRFRIRGWRMHLEELYDRIGWTMYYMKEQRIRQESDQEEEMKEVNKVITHGKSLFQSV